MNRYPVKSKPRNVRTATSAVIDATPSPIARGPFTSFRYACTEVSLAGGKARVRSRRAELEDGVLRTESFEGEIDGAVYDRMVANAQQQFIAQTARVLESLAAFLPASWKRPASRN